MWRCWASAPGAAVLRLLTVFSTLSSHAVLGNGSSKPAYDVSARGDAKVAGAGTGIDMPFFKHAFVEDLAALHGNTSSESHGISLAARADGWEEAIAKGKRYLDMLKCGNGPPSKFTSYDDLKKWGWEKDYDENPTAGLTRSMQQAVEYLGASTSSEDVRQVLDIHQIEVTVEGTTYVVTGATYENYYNAEYIIAAINYGPKESPGENDFDGPLPLLRRQSDVLFLEYQRLMELEKKPLTGLKGLLRSNVQNSETQDYAARALGMDKYDSSKLPDWPGRDFDAGSDELAALIASPNGRAPVWLLGTHKEKLGHKTISKARVWGHNHLLSILFTLEEVSEGSSEDEEDDSQSSGSHDKAVSKKSGVNTLSARDKVVRGLSPRAGSSLTWEERVAKGKVLLEMLKCGVCPPSAFSSFDDLEKWGWKRGNDPKVTSAGHWDQDHQNAFNYLQLSPEGKRLLYAIDEHSGKRVIDGQTYEATGASYGNHYSSELIIATNNWSPRSEGPENAGVDGITKPFPKLERLSDVTFLEFQQIMKSNSKPTDQLKGNFQSHVANSETKDLLKKVFNGEEPFWPGRDFEAGSDEFAALLASPNGRGVVWFLGQHSEALGRKTISKVRAWYGKFQTTYLLFVFEENSESDTLGDWDAGDDSDGDLTSAEQAPANTRRAHSLQIARRGDSDELDWNHLVTKGKTYLDMLNCGSGRESRWTAYGDLKKYGWKKTRETHSYSIYEGGSALVAMDYLKVSTKPADQWYVFDEHIKETKTDGKKYYPTGARYSNKFNMEFIVAVNNFGPQNEGPKRLRPSVTGDPNPFPPLAQWSDLVFLEFSRIMKSEKKPTNRLKGILRACVVNPETSRIAAKALGHSLNAAPFGWPGRDFDADSDEFAALIASPNGRGVVWFLATHKEALGHKTIAQVKVYDNGGLNLLFVLKDATQGSASRRPVEHLPARRDPIAYLTKRTILARDISQEQYYKLVENGEILMLELQSTEDCFPAKVFVEYHSLDDWGWTSTVRPELSMNYEPAAQVYEYLGASTSAQLNRVVVNEHARTRDKGGKRYLRTGAKYENTYNPKLLTAQINFGPRFEGRLQNPPVLGGPDTPFPLLSHQSNVMFLEYQKFMADLGQPMDQLKGVWRESIVNDFTTQLAVKLASRDGRPSGIPRWPGRDFGADSEQLAAFLASPNGIAVAYLLLQHRDKLGTKTISKVRVWNDDTGVHLLFVIDDLRTTASRSLTRKRRASEHVTPTQVSPLHSTNFSRRADEPDSEDVSEAKNAGRYFTMVQEAPVDVLETCLQIKQSSFTRMSQLRDSGWTLLEDRQQAVEEESDAATFNSWLDLNLDLTAGGNHKIEYQHLEKTTGSDGRVYYPSGAYYRNLFTVGAVAALDNASPWKAGRDRNPPVDGQRNPYPPLRQWSDEVFLVYKDFCKGDPTKMKKLKGVLRHNVVNAPTKKALHAYMEKHGELENGAPKVWPGTLYKLDQDGFNVALGVPNGKGAAYLLATHRESLGWKEIYQIRIFSVDASSPYNILYYIRDHQENAERVKQIRALALEPKSPPRLSLKAANKTEQSSQEDYGLKKTKDLSLLAPAPRLLQPRDALEEAYEKAKTKGEVLLCKLRAEDADPSPWKDYSELAAYGWNDATDKVAEESNLVEMQSTLEDMGLSSSGDDNIQLALKHTQKTEHNGQSYPESGATYYNIFNVKGGAIIAAVNRGPDHAPTATGIDKANIVPLKQYSDVTFLAWQHVAGNNVKNLKYLIRKFIMNFTTQDTIRHVLKKRGKTVEEWPGLKIPMSDPDAQALLGTPNGNGAAWLLLQHREQLGRKDISHVTIFSTGHGFSLCFWFVDGESPSPTTAEQRRDVSIGAQGGAVQISSADTTKRSDDFVEPASLPPLSVTPGTWPTALLTRLQKAVQGCWSALWIH